MSTRRDVLCPHCQKTYADTVTQAPYVQRPYAFSTKQFVGCASCVRQQLVGEVRVSLLAAWHSVASLLVNLLFLFWNALRLPFVRPNPEKVEALLHEVGAGGDPVDLAKVAASLAAAMVMADGKVKPEEVDTALELGPQYIVGFSPELFIELLEDVRELPSPHTLGSLLADQLDLPAKRAILSYLHAIAACDRHIDAAEVELLTATADALGVVRPEISVGDL